MSLGVDYFFLSCIKLIIFPESKEILSLILESSHPLCLQQLPLSGIRLRPWYEREVSPRHHIQLFSSHEATETWSSNLALCPRRPGSTRSLSGTCRLRSFCLGSSPTPEAGFSEAPFFSESASPLWVCFYGSSFLSLGKIRRTLGWILFWEYDNDDDSNENDNSDSWNYLLSTY